MVPSRRTIHKARSRRSIVALAMARGSECKTASLSREACCPPYWQPTRLNPASFTRRTTRALFVRPMLDQAGKRSPSAGRRACASAAPMHWPWCPNSQQRDGRHFCRHRAPTRGEATRLRNRVASPLVATALRSRSFSPRGGAASATLCLHALWGRAAYLHREPFCLMEGQTILAQLSRTVRFESLTRHPIEPEPLITLRPKGSMWKRVHRRTDRDEQQAGGGPHP